MRSVKKIADASLCSACGVCVSVCPKNAISLKKTSTFSASVNDSCVECGICTDICTATETRISDLYQQNDQTVPDNIYTGNYKECYNVSTKDTALLIGSTSGGFVSGVIKRLLEDKEYDCAFLVNTYNYDSLLVAHKTTSFDTETQKSRYLSVSMEELIKEMLSNKNERIIICAVPCAVQAICNVIRKYKLDRSNYLILGLFCDNTQSYRLNDYFKTLNKHPIKKLYFRDKKVSGWPGNVRIILENNKEKCYPSTKRINAKKYFKLKRCFTCFDKLNCFADISIGDNYTGKSNFKGGANSIILRTEIGSRVFKKVMDDFLFDSISIDDIYKSQSIEKRKQNIVNAAIISSQEDFTIYPDMPQEFSEKDISLLNNDLQQLSKDLEQIKKEIKQVEFKQLIKKIKRKLKLK